MLMMSCAKVFIWFACLQAALAAPSGEWDPGHEVHTYEFDIHEDGTELKERLMVDEDRNLEVIQVPSHNDVTGATYIHDFNLNVTLRREEGEGRCYLTDLSRDLEAGLQPRPRDMVAAITAPKGDDDSKQIETTSFKWTVGAAVTEEERAGFGPEMRELCDDQTIHRLDRVEDSVTVREESSDLLHHTRRMDRRSFVETNCSKSLVRSRCIISLRNCRYTLLVTCEKKKRNEHLRGDIAPTYYDCKTKYEHIHDSVMCCLDCCSDASRADSIMPYCQTVTEQDVRNSRAHC